MKRRVECLKVLTDTVSWRFKHRVQITYKCFICCFVLETEEQGQSDPMQPLRRYRIILFQRPRASIFLAKMVEERDTLILRIACSARINERGEGWNKNKKSVPISTIK